MGHMPDFLNFHCENFKFHLVKLRLVLFSVSAARPELIAISWQSAHTWLGHKLAIREVNKHTHEQYAGYKNPMKLHRKSAP